MSHMTACDHCGRLFPVDGHYNTIIRERKSVFDLSPLFERHVCDECFEELDEWLTFEPGGEDQE